MTVSPATSPAGRPSSLEPLIILLVNRASLVVLAYLGLALMPATRPTEYVMPGNLLINGWTRWDASWYARIATSGFTNRPIDASGQRDTAFAPGYPMLMRMVGWLIGDAYIAGWLISMTAFAIAGLVLHALVQQRLGPDVARRTLILLCVFPFSYIFTAIYSESLFLLCTVGAFWFIEKRWWPAAALCAAASGATRIAGIATAIALMVAYLQQIGWSWRKAGWGALWIALGFGGILGYALFLWIRFNEPLAFITAQNAAGWADNSSWELFKHTLGQWVTPDFWQITGGNVGLIATLHIAIIVLTTVLACFVWRMLPLPYAVWTTIILFMSYSRWGSFGRMVSVAFPLFIVAAALMTGRRVYHGIVYASIILLALLTLMFTHGYWVA